MASQTTHVKPTGVRLVSELVDGKEWLYLEDVPVIGTD